MSLRFQTNGADRPWQQRPSDHVLGNRRYWHGPILPMEEPSTLSRLFVRIRRWM